jgi:hypothetical protein
MGNGLYLCRMRVGAGGSPQVSTKEPRPRLKHGDTSMLYPCAFSLMWPPLQVTVKSCLLYYPLTNFQECKLIVFMFIVTFH